MGKKLTLKEVKERLKVINPNIEILSDEYVNSKAKLCCKCSIDDNIWYANWGHLKDGHGCPKCGIKTQVGARTFSIEYIKEKLMEINSNIIILSEYYKNSNTKLRCKCLIDEYEWETTWNSLSQGKGCHKCANIIKLSIEDIKLKIIKDNYVPISDEYKNSKSKFAISDTAGYKYFLTISDILHNSNHDEYKFDKRNKFNVQNIKLWLKLNNSKYTLISNKNTATTQKMKWYCPECDNEFKCSFNSIKRGGGCGVCHGLQTTTSTSLYTKRPDLHKYIVDLEFAKIINEFSSKKLKIICPNCKKEKNKLISANDLSSGKFRCDYCSDGISIPEKFMSMLLKELNIDFITQYSEAWSRSKRYDFYIPSLNMIVETHGMQHYEKPHNGRTVQQEQENDRLKYELAIQNGIKSENYIVVDCRKSELEWLKENCIMLLSNNFDLSNIDWEDIYINCQKSIIPKIWEIWNNKNNNNHNIYTISESFGINRATVVRYLKRGNYLGMCIYNSHDEIVKEKRKQTYQYALNGKYVNSFKSITDAAKHMSTSQGSISQCCRRKTKTSNTFKWSYNPPINGMYPD